MAVSFSLLLILMICMPFCHILTCWNSRCIAKIIPVSFLLDLSFLGSNFALTAGLRMENNY